MGILGSVFKIGTSLIGSASAKKASRAAQAAQIEMQQRGIDTLNRQFNTSTTLASPWTSTGSDAARELAILLGIGGGDADWNAYLQGNPDVLRGYYETADTSQFPTPESYAQWHYKEYGQKEGRNLPMGGGDTGAAIEALKASPIYQALFNNGVETTLANASATGGLRGGRTQDALARVGTDTLAKVYQDRVANLGGVSGMGLNAVGGLQNLGAANADAVAALFGKQGDTRAGGILQRSAINNQMLNTVSEEAGKIGKSIGLPF